MRAWCAPAAPPRRWSRAGHVRVNGSRVLAPGHVLRANDVVTLALDRSVKVTRVIGFVERRGGALAARALYERLSRG
jgi:ribosome-associated heat shock protein Hsp15